MLSVTNSAQLPISFRLDVGPLASHQERYQSQVSTQLPYYSVVLAGADLLGPCSRQAAPGARLYFGGPGQLAHVLAQVPAHYAGQVLRFTDDFLSACGPVSESLLSLFHDASLDEPLLLPAGAKSEVTFLLAHLAQPTTQHALLHEALCRSYLQTLLLRCVSLRQQQQPSITFARPSLFLRFRKLLEQYYTEWKSVTAYADKLCVTPNHLSVSIKRETGRPASAHIQQRIMLEAQRLLANHDTPLKEIAYQLGFDDVAHFSKLFKRCHGVSFSHFKATSQHRHAGLVSA